MQLFHEGVPGAREKKATPVGVIMGASAPYGASATVRCTNECKPLQRKVLDCIVECKRKVCTHAQAAVAM